MNNLMGKVITMVIATGILLGCGVATSQPVYASEPFLGEIRAVGFNFTPQGWAPCDGRLIPIQQNSALFALLGTMYGGNGTTNFGLPDLRGRVALGVGNGPGLTPRVQGEAAGVESVTLLSAQMPAHAHQNTAAATAGTTNTPSASVYPAGMAVTATASDRTEISVDANAYASPANTAMGYSTVAGNSQPHENMQPYLGVNYIIALQGIFPSRD